MLKRTTISLIVLSNLISFNFSANASTAEYDVKESLFREYGRPDPAFLNEPPPSIEPLPPSSTFPPHNPEQIENSINILPEKELMPSGPVAL